MADVDGNWECTVKSPLGDQKLTLAVTADGDSFNGTASGAMGSSDVTGTVAGNTLTWQQQVTVPMPMSLDCTATVDGDAITGQVTAGAFGSFPLNGTRSS